MSKKYKSSRVHIPNPLKRLVAEKSDGKCAKCGKEATSAVWRRGILTFYDESGAAFEYNHKVSILFGGKNDIDNLELACRRCNRTDFKQVEFSDKLMALSDKFNAKKAEVDMTHFNYGRHHTESAKKRLREVMLSRQVG